MVVEWPLPGLRWSPTAGLDAVEHLDLITILKWLRDLAASGGSFANPQIRGVATAVQCQRVLESLESSAVGVSCRQRSEWSGQWIRPEVVRGL